MPHRFAVGEGDQRDSSCESTSRRSNAFDAKSMRGSCRREDWQGLVGVYRVLVRYKIVTFDSVIDC